MRLLRKQTDKNETLARQRATVDMVLHEKKDEALIAARKKFAQLRDSGSSLTQFACKPTTDHPEENAAILMILNNYEFIAVGIREGALDEKIFMRMKKSLVIRDWKDLNGYVVEMRKNSERDKLFVEIEWLANKWDRAGHIL